MTVTDVSIFLVGSRMAGGLAAEGAGVSPEWANCDAEGACRATYGGTRGCGRGCLCGDVCAGQPLLFGCLCGVQDGDVTVNKVGL